MKPLNTYPSPAPRTPPELQALILNDRQRDWVLHRSDYSTAIATSIKDHKGVVTAAINLSGPDAVMDPPGVQDQFKNLLLTCSADISRELGYAP